MTSKADFTEDEWTRLKRSPFVAGMAISLADPGGPIEAFKETHAALNSVVDAARAQSGGPLVDALAGEVVGAASAKHNPLAGFRPTGSDAQHEILEELRGVNAIVTAKAAPEDADALRGWLLRTAEAAANAAKE